MNTVLAETMLPEAPVADQSVAPSMAPRMTPSEADCFAHYAGRAEALLEWGCGGSTVVAAVAGAKTIDSVESDAAWIEKCKATPELAPRVADGTVRFHHVDVGRIKSWGKPASKKTALQWPAYYLAVWATLPRLPDLVLVDGRWRVSCTLQALLRCEANTTIMIHDFTRRGEYGAVLEFADLVEKVNKLGVFRRKPDIDWRRVALAVTEYALNSR